MKKLLILGLLVFLFSFDAWSQSNDLTSFNTDRLQVNKIGMIVLGGWALGNIGINGVLLKNPKSAEQGHFYRMNIFWNVVNLGLAIPGLRRSMITDPASLNMAETVSEFHQMGKVLIFNAGLDIAYIAGGFLLKEMAGAFFVKLIELTFSLNRHRSRSYSSRGQEFVFFSVMQTV